MILSNAVCKIGNGNMECAKETKNPTKDQKTLDFDTVGNSAQQAGLSCPLNKIVH